MGYISSPPWDHAPKKDLKKLREKVDLRTSITILGSGTSTGTPVLGCSCQTCRSKNPKNQRLRASVLFRSKGKTFLIDTSPDLRAQAFKNQFYWLDAVLYTHPHADHLHGIDELRSFNFLMGRQIPVYGNAWSLKEISEKFRYIFYPTQEGGGKPNLSLHLLEEPTSIAGIKVIPLPLIHGAMPVLGFRIKNIAYITDCSYVPDDTFKLLKNLDVLVFDCLRPSKHPTHFCVEEAIDVARKIGAKRTYFTHMGHELEYTKFSKSLPEGMSPAFDGLKVFSV